MAYRRTERVEKRLKARHDALLAAACELAAEEGMNAVQIAPVADRAGIAAGTVYRYFPSKVALVEALAADVAAAELQAIRVAADAAPGPLSALACALVTLGARAIAGRRLIWALTSEPVDADAHQARLAFRRAIVEEISARLAAAREQLSDIQPGLAAPAIVSALLEGLVGPLAADDSSTSERDAVRMLALFALRGAGIVDARARGLVVQAPWPAESTLNAT